MIDEKLIDDGQISMGLGGGSIPHTNMKIEARKMLALEEIARQLSYLEDISHNTKEIMSLLHKFDKPSLQVVPVGPALEHETPGAGFTRRRRGAENPGE